RPVTERAERPQQGVEPLAQLVPVHRRFVQQPEDGELKHARALTGHAARTSRLAIAPGCRARTGWPGLSSGSPDPVTRAEAPDMTARCIGPIHRKDMRGGARTQARLLRAPAATVTDASQQQVS